MPLTVCSLFGEIETCSWTNVMAKQQDFLVAFSRPEHDAAEEWKAEEGSRHINF